MKKLLVISGMVLIICLISYLPQIMITPGHLSKKHQALYRTCLSCHIPFSGASASKCIECHQTATIGLDSIGRVTNSKVLFHKNLQNQDCMSCHHEHKVRDAKITSGVFNHSLLSLSNQANCVGCHTAPKTLSHQSLLSNNCANCHITTNWKAAAFNHKQLTAAALNNCVSCHKAPSDVFHSQNSISNCNTCHSFEGWKPSTFNHSDYFTLDGHHNASCITCHTSNNFKLYTCFGCHEHSEQNLMAEHNEHGITNFSNCIECHKSGNEHEGRGGEKEDGGDDD